MLAQRLMSTNPVHISPFDVVGQFDSNQPTFVVHLALFDHETSMQVKDGEEVRVFHIKPPVERSAQLPINMFGSAGLTQSQVKKMQTWRETVLADSNKARSSYYQYVARPHCKVVVDAKSGIERYRRYSCAGLVIECYKHAGIELIDVDERNLPEVSLAEVVAVYPEAKQEHLRAHIGLDCAEPYRLVLPGYVMNSLKDLAANPGRSVPYKAQKDDCRFS